MKTILQGMMFVLLGALFSASALAKVVVIVHPSVAVPGLDQDSLSKLYLGKSNTLPGGVRLAPVDQEKGTASRSKFYEVVVQKTESQLTAYWSRLIFTGKGEPPKMLANDKEVKALVASNPGMIGYVDAALVDTTVKVVFEVP